jgi:poly-gamma-glutamate biosynthesis protein PgsC/CapC
MIVAFSLMGLFFTSLFTSLISITPGGMIVPLYLSLYMKEPERIVGTVAVSFTTLFLYKIISSLFLIDKKKTVIIMILISTLLTYTWWKFMPALFPFDFVFKTAGWIIPGILANTMNKQGLIKTVLSCSICTLSLFLIYILIFSI